MQEKKPAASRLEEIDTNFKNRENVKELTWIDAFDPRLALRGLAWLSETGPERSFRRLPDRAAASLSPGVQFLSHSPASAFLSFFTDATDISVRLFNQDEAFMPHMPLTGSSGAQLYTREGLQWIPVAVAVPPPGKRDFERPLLMGAPRAWREYRLYLPLYKAVEEASLGLSVGARVEPAPAAPGTRPIFFYGTSITQGGCANTAGSDYVSILGRTLDTEVINFGFSGCGKGEPEVARLIREIDAELFVLDYAANCEPEGVRDTLPEFVRLLREKHPATPIVLLSHVAFDKIFWDAETRDKLDRRRDEMMRFYLRAKEAGDARLYFIDGDGVLPPGLTGAYVDGVHPTSAGFAIMAERLAPHLLFIRAWNRQDCGS